MAIPPNCFVLQYANDIVVGIESPYDRYIEDTLNIVCDSLVPMFRDLGLRISSEKSEVLVFSRRHRDPVVNVYVEGNLISVTSSFRYLGVFFTSAKKEPRYP